MYMLLCNNGCYYTGSTRNLKERIEQHEVGEGANYTRKHLPVELVYYERYSSVSLAFEREQQLKGWSRKKKKALIRDDLEQLQRLSICQNDSHFKNWRKSDHNSCKG